MLICLLFYEFQSFNLDSPSKQSYVGSFYQPPETLSRRLYMNTITDQLDRKSSGVQDISPQLYQRVPDAGSRGTLSLIDAVSKYLRPNVKVSNFSCIWAAVISALKTLQEKMRRLELERVQAERNIQQFSHATRHQADASAQREPENSTRENHPTQRNGNWKCWIAVIDLFTKFLESQIESSLCYASFQGWFLSFILQKSVALCWKNSSIIWGKWWSVQRKTESLTQTDRWAGRQKQKCLCHRLYSKSLNMLLILIWKIHFAWKLSKPLFIPLSFFPPSTLIGI